MAIERRTNKEGRAASPRELLRRCQKIPYTFFNLK